MLLKEAAKNASLCYRLMGRPMSRRNILAGGIGQSVTKQEKVVPAPAKAPISKTEQKRKTIRRSGDPVFPRVIN
jgi:hypothetical protein